MNTIIYNIIMNCKNNIMHYKNNNNNILDEKLSHDLVKIKQTIIDKLPEDLVSIIYRDYLEVEVYYIMYTNICNLPISRELNNTKLLPLIPIILSKPHVCTYISTKCRAFRYSYLLHKERKIKLFELFNNGSSFASTILFSLYHYLMFNLYD